MKETLRERLESKLVPGANGCLEFTGFRNRGGYGLISVGERMSYAHRAAWMLANGEIPDGLHVLHRCDNPSCSNADHLFLGTHADNMADKVQKGRQSRAGSGNRVVDSDIAHFMFILAVEGHYQRAIAKRLGIHYMTVYRYLHGKVVAK